MYDYGARYYNPKFSIWLSTDPLAEKYPNFNPYNYTMQNPINLVDPDGRAPYDWKRVNGLMVYDKTLTSTSPLGFGETYVGKTHEDVTLFGVYGLNTYNYYQEDGNIISVGSIYDTEITNEKSLGDIIVYRMRDFDSWFNSNCYGTSTTHAYEGIDGMYNSADMLDNIGSNLSCIPGVSALFGKIGSYSADVLRTIADFNGGVTDEQAAINLGVRVTVNAAGEKIGNSIKNAELSKEKSYIYDQTVRILTDEVKNQSTKKPKE